MKKLSEAIKAPEAKKVSEASSTQINSLANRIMAILAKNDKEVMKLIKEWETANGPLGGSGDIFEAYIQGKEELKNRLIDEMEQLTDETEAD